MKKIMLLGAGGFIGTNLAIKLYENPDNQIALVDKKDEYFQNLRNAGLDKAEYKINSFEDFDAFQELVRGEDIVYHLVSTTVPTTSNQHISEELTANVIMTSKLLEACVAENVKKVVFISSGGTVYGKENACPLPEETPTYPISSYGIQKVTIEKLLYLYKYLYGLDYRVIRLANPYGPYQRPDGVLGAATTFTYKALKKEQIVVYGDGSVVRDYIYIDDAIRGIINIVDGDNHHRTFNLGSGKGTSIKELLGIIENVVDHELDITYMPGRKVDVPVNYLDISRYEKAYGELNPLPLEEGIRKTVEFWKER